MGSFGGGRGGFEPVNLNTLKVEKREEGCFVEEEEAIVLSQSLGAPLKAVFTAHPASLSLGA